VTVRRKNIRLPARNYVGKRWYFVTVCSNDRRPCFARPQEALALISALRAVSASRAFAIHAFCVMSDHVHLLLEGLADRSRLQQFMTELKHRTALDWRRKHGGRLWQAKFYDHILRPRDSPDRVAWYIWMNPVRKGLCDDPHQYAFSGSFTLDWKQAPRPPEPWQPPWM